MRHLVAYWTEWAFGTHEAQVGRAAGVHASIVCDLQRKPRLLEPRFEHGSPPWMERPVVRLQLRFDFFPQVVQLGLQRLNLLGVLTRRPAELVRLVEAAFQHELFPSQRVQLRSLRAASLVGHDLPRQLGHDQTRPPAQRALRPQDIRVHVYGQARASTR